jgi:hypothetical protein
VLYNFDYTTNINLTTLAMVFNALKLLERGDEAELVKELIDSALIKLTKECWLSDDFWSFSQILWGIAMLDMPDLLPKKLVAHRIESMANNRKKYTYSMLVSFIKKDWEEVIKYSDKILAIRDDIYKTYGFRAFAKMKLGEKSGIDSDMEIYLKYESGDRLYKQFKDAYKRFQSYNGI